MDGFDRSGFEGLIARHQDPVSHCQIDKFTVWLEYAYGKTKVILTGRRQWSGDSDGGGTANTGGRRLRDVACDGQVRRGKKECVCLAVILTV